MSDSLITLSIYADNEYCAFARLTFNPYWSTHFLDDILANWETQACTSHISKLVVLKLTVVLEEAVNTMLRHSNAVILHTDLELNSFLVKVLEQDTYLYKVPTICEL